MGDTAVLILAVSLLALVIGYGVYVVIRGRRSEVEERLGRYAFPAEEEEEERAFSPLGERLERAVAGRGFAENLRTQLASANVKLKVSEFMAATVIIVIVLALLAYVVSRGNALLALVGGVLGFFLPRWYLGILQRRRLKAFNAQLSDTINLMVNSIRAGYSALQAMEAVAEEMGPPTSEEFRRVVREVQLGLSIEQALNNLLRRVPSDDLDLMITAMNIQREVGGNLAEVLDNISFTIRERIRILGDIRSLTAQGRYSGYLVSLLPVFVSVFIFFINPDFTRQLTEKPCGWIMIGVAVLLEVLAYIVIQKIVSIEV
jgi:tight adherence protein B